MIKGLHPLSTLFSLKVNSRKMNNSDGGRCVACLTSHARHGLCPACRADLPVNRWHCHACALPLPFALPAGLCGECQATPPPFSRAIIPWRYQFPIDGMIGRYKYHGQRQFIRPLLAEFGELIEQQIPAEDRPDWLVPAPMHWSRRWQRGFNQAADIAECLSSHLDIPLDSGLIYRCRQVQAQRGLNRATRLANLQGVFRVRGTVPERIALVDDVVTTGATAKTLARHLLDAGAREVQLWALARTPG